MYVASKGGEKAIENAHRWLAEERRGNPETPELTLAQIAEQLGRSVDRVMSEGSLYDPELAALAVKQAQGDLIEAASMEEMPSVADILAHEGLIESGHPGESADEVGDLTRDALHFPADRDIRLQNLARGDEGFLLSLAYSTQRGFGNSHPFVGELRVGEIAVEVEPEELGFPVEIGSILMTECQMVNQFKGSARAPTIRPTPSASASSLNGSPALRRRSVRPRLR